MAAELIPSAIAKYIAPYMVHHSLDRDTMLLQYIEVREMDYFPPNKYYTFRGHYRKKIILLTIIRRPHDRLAKSCQLRGSFLLVEILSALHF